MHVDKATITYLVARGKMTRNDCSTIFLAYSLAEALSPLIDLVEENVRHVLGSADVFPSKSKLEKRARCWARLCLTDERNSSWQLVL